jgi:DNA-binding response OmpR family regulator
MRILIIEDNLPIANAVRAMLEARKFAVDVATDGIVGLDHLLRETYDVAVVDVVLPGKTGFEIVRDARAEDVHTPVLMLTARDAVEDRVRGLDSGADDYLVKPFVEEELIARVNALLRRGDKPISAVATAGTLTVVTGSREARYDGLALELGTTEFRLLEFLARNANIAFSRAQLLARVWDYDFEGSSNIVDVYVSQLRRKLRLAGGRDVIETVWGVGYKLTA